MQSVKEAKTVLMKNVKNAKPVAYWIKDNTFIFKTAGGKCIESNYFIVDGSEVRVTNPILSDLTPNGMKLL